jgi:DNA-binding MarR family transcriptional regulator
MTSKAAQAAGKGAAARPLTALLSQALVAFTIEADNELEHRLPHRTTRGPAASSRRGPWLVSLVMWSNFLRFVSADGVPVRELPALTGMSQQAVSSQLTRMEKWWGYVTAGPDPSDSRPAPPRRDWIVRPTPAGLRAQQIWRTLPELIEERWQGRFGPGEASGLRESLQAVAGQLDARLPHYLPVGGTAVLQPRGPVPASRGAGADPRLSLPALLSRVLLAFTIDFERSPGLPLVISANTLRVLTDEGVRLADLPRRAGISKEAASVSVGILESRGYAEAGPDPATGRRKAVRLTPKGLRAQDASRRLLAVIEERWRARYAADCTGRLRESLQGLLDPVAGGQSRLSEGLRPYPDGWRAHQPYLAQTTAMIADPGRSLPHYPVVSHRGGFPDGS